MYQYLLTGHKPCRLINQPSLYDPCSCSASEPIIKTGFKEWNQHKSIGQMAEEFSYMICVNTDFPKSREINNSEAAVEMSNLRDGTLQSVPQFKSTDLLRFAVGSVWPWIVLVQLTGLEIPQGLYVWKFPFKFIAFIDQFRKYLNALNKIENTRVPPDELPKILNEIASDIIAGDDDDSKDHETVDTNTEHILKSLSYFDKHFEKSAAIAKQCQENGDKDSQIGAKEDISEPTEEVLEHTAERANGVCDAIDSKLNIFCTCLSAAREDLQVFVNLMDNYLNDSIALRQKLLDGLAQTIKFNQLWHLFQPGDLVVSSRVDSMQAYRVIHVSGGRPQLVPGLKTGHKLYATLPDSVGDLSRQSDISPFTIDCIRFDFDGEMFGPVHEVITIDEFDDERFIKDLKIFPLRFADNPESIKSNLTTRGKLFVKFAGVQHVRYSGLTVEEPREEV